MEKIVEASNLDKNLRQILNFFVWELGAQLGISDVACQRASLLIKRFQARNPQTDESDTGHPLICITALLISARLENDSFSHVDLNVLISKSLTLESYPYLLQVWNDNTFFQFENDLHYMVQEEILQAADYRLFAFHTPAALTETLFVLLGKGKGRGENGDTFGSIPLETLQKEAAFNGYLCLMYDTASHATTCYYNATHCAVASILVALRSKSSVLRERSQSLETLERELFDLAQISESEKENIRKLIDLVVALRDILDIKEVEKERIAS